MTGRVFNESLVPSLDLPAGEREELLARARTEGAAFAKTLVSRGLLSAESLRHAYETLCGLPPRNPFPSPPSERASWCPCPWTTGRWSSRWRTRWTSTPARRSPRRRDAAWWFSGGPGRRAGGRWRRGTADRPTPGG